MAICHYVNCGRRAQYPTPDGQAACYQHRPTARVVLQLLADGYKIIPLEPSRKERSQQKPEPRPGGRRAAANRRRAEAIGIYIEHRSECVYCGEPLGIDNHSLDHVVPTSRGGRNDADNTAPACRFCNHAKANLTAAEFLAVRHDDEMRKKLIRTISNAMEMYHDRSIG